MRINDPVIAEKITMAISDMHARRIISASIPRAKSANELADELAIPLRSIYRYIEELCNMGLLAGERQELIDSGGKYMLYRSLVKSVTVQFGTDGLDVDLIPNEDIVGKFMRLWASLGRHQE